MKYLKVRLNLSNNRLMTLPEDLGLLSGVEELFLQYNHLTELLVIYMYNVHYLCSKQVVLSIVKYMSFVKSG